MNLLEVFVSICCVFLGVSIIYSAILLVSFIKEKEDSFDDYLTKLDEEFSCDFVNDKYRTYGFHKESSYEYYGQKYADDIDIIDVEFQVI